VWGGPHPLPPSPPPSPEGGIHAKRSSFILHPSGVGGEAVTIKGITHTFYPEHGIHGLWNEYRNLHATLERFGIAPDLFLAQEEEWIHFERGRVRRAQIGSFIREAFLPAPLHYLELFTHPTFLGMLGWRDWLSLPNVWYGLLLAVALDPFGREIALAGQTLQDFLRGWGPRVRGLFIGLARSSLATRPGEASLAAFIAFLRFYTLMRRDGWRFAYLTTDPGTALIEPLIERFRARGGELILGTRVDLLESLPPPSTLISGGWRVEGGGRTFNAEHLILAVDAPAARRLLSESPATRAEAEKLNWPQGLETAVVRVWLDAPPRPGPEAGVFTGDFIVDNFFWLHRLQHDFAEWARATGGSAVEMHIYGPPDFLALPDTVILARAITDLYLAYPELRGHTCHQTLQRNPATHSRLIVDKAERWLGVYTPWPNVWACGDWVRGPWPALFLERACVSGLVAANAALETMGLDPFPILPYSEPEWLAGQIQKWLLGGRRLVKQWQMRK
jgi:isorenieratene synthase